MGSTLMPVQAVTCPSTGLLVSVEECRGCGCVMEVRQPWRHFAVKCRIGGRNEGAYP